MLGDGMIVLLHNTTPTATNGCRVQTWTKVMQGKHVHLPNAQKQDGVSEALIQSRVEVLEVS